jgi:uncharacterized membrane protein YfcA
MILQELNVMLIRTLYSEQASIIAAVVCSLIVAGLLKGTIGVGMPVVALPLLSLFIDIKAAAMLLSMPLNFSNLPQALEGGKTGQCLMQLMPVILGANVHRRSVLAHVFVFVTGAFAADRTPGIRISAVSLW